MKIPRKSLKVEVPSVAMGDIAFNLLIFFVILAKAQDDGHLKWKAAETPKVEPTDHVKVSIVVDEKNDLYLNGRQLGINQLAAGIEHALRDAPAGSRTVLLKIHDETQAQRFEPIIEAVSAAGGEMVHVLREKKP